MPNIIYIIMKCNTICTIGCLELRYWKHVDIESSAVQLSVTFGRLTISKHCLRSIRPSSLRLRPSSVSFRLLGDTRFSVFTVSV